MSQFRTGIPWGTVIEPQPQHGWRVHIDGKPIGIVETNYEWASKYWAERARILGKTITLVPQ